MNVLNNPLLSKMSVVMRGLRSVAQELERDIPAQAASDKLNVESFSQKAGALAALNLHLQNMNRFINPDNVETNINRIISNMDDEFQETQTHKTASAHPALFDAAWQHIIGSTKTSIKTKMDILVIEASSLLAGRLDTASLNRDKFTRGATKTYTDFIKDISPEDHKKSAAPPHVRYSHKLTCAIHAQPTWGDEPYYPLYTELYIDNMSHNYIDTTTHGFKTHFSKYVRLVSETPNSAIIIKKYNKPIDMFTTFDAEFSKNM